MVKKTYGIIGLGKFGSKVARELVDKGESVILCDNSQENFRDFRQDVENIYTLDSTDKLALEEAGIRELDVVIVSIGEKIEASILTVMALKELGNKRIIAKATSKPHGEILEKIGANDVIYPEREIAKKLVSELTSSRIEVTMLSSELSVCKALASDIFGKRTIAEIQESSIKKDEHGATTQEIKIVAIKQNNIWNLHPTPDITIHNEDFVIFLANEKTMEVYVKKFELL